MDTKEISTQVNNNAAQNQAVYVPELSEQTLARAENQIALFVRLKAAAIKATNPSDWCDQSGSPYLQMTGTSKIATVFGVSIFNQEQSSEEFEDELGKYIIFTATATFVWNNRSCVEVGTGSTRDPFFGKINKCNKCGAKGKTGKHEGCEGEIVSTYKPLSEVDIPSVQKKAVTNLHNRGIKRILGLHFTWEDIEAAGIAKDSTSKVTRKGEKGGEEVSDKFRELKDKIRQACLDLNDGDKKKSVTYLEKITAWTNKEGKEIPGIKKVDDIKSEKQAEVIWGKIKPEYEAWIKKNPKETIDSVKNKIQSVCLKVGVGNPEMAAQFLERCTDGKIKDIGKIETIEEARAILDLVVEEASAFTEE